MQITRQADYAVRAVLHLAQIKNGERAATSTVAKEQRIPPHSWRRSFLSFRLQGYFILLEAPAEVSRLHGIPRTLLSWKLSRRLMVPFNSMNAWQKVVSVHSMIIAQSAQSGARRRKNW